MQWECHQDAINKSDVYGDMHIDSVYRGTDWFLQCEFMEYKAGSLAAAYPWGTSIGLAGVIGRLASNFNAPLVLTSTTGTPAVATPATLSAPIAVLAPGSNPHAQFNSRLRTMPVRMVLLPVDIGGGVIRSFALT